MADESVLSISSNGLNSNDSTQISEPTCSLNMYFEISKNKLRWNGTLEELKTFVRRELNEETSTWKSPGGGTWVSNSKNLSVTWHKKSKTVSIKGERSEECYCHIFNAMAGNVSEEISPSNSSSHHEEDNMVDIHIVTDHCKHEGPNTEHEKTIKCDECTKLSIEMTEAQMDITLLWAKVNALDKKPPSSSCNCESLMKENNSLRLEIESLRNKLANISDRCVNNDIVVHPQPPAKSVNSQAKLEEQIKEYRQSRSEKYHQRQQTNSKSNPSDPKTKTKNDNTNSKDTNSKDTTTIKNLQSKLSEVICERDSLKTAIQIITKEHPSYTQESTENRPWQKAETKKTKKSTKKSTKKPSETIKQPNTIITGNQMVDTYNMFSPLVDQVDQNPTVDSSDSAPSQQNQSANPSGFLILGDSMTKGIRSNLLAKSTKSTVYTKSFSGATVGHMQHYMVPPMQRKPKHVIVHVGTNDTNTKQPKEICEDLHTLSEKISEICPEATVAISSIITRSDPKTTGMICELNNNIKQMCSKYGLQFINNDNIKVSDLNRSGVHLNRRGNSLLAQNFKLYMQSL